jgi:hypothetical protein
VYVSTPLEAKKSMFLLLPEGWFGDLHPAPNRQLVILMRGGPEVTASDGEVRRFKPGDSYSRALLNLNRFPEVNLSEVQNV